MEKRKKDKFLSFAFFPWQQDKDPYWVNPENGLLWYIDEDLTDYANNPDKSTGEPLGAACFYVAEKRDDDKIHGLTRVLIDKESNDVLHETGSLESMAIKIDALRFVKTNK